MKKIGKFFAVLALLVMFISIKAFFPAHRAIPRKRPLAGRPGFQEFLALAAGRLPGIAQCCIR
jgi:hypothetical protein